MNKLLSFLPFLIVFIASIYIPYDSDLGWHLKYGEYFFQNGKILRDNTFSTMMPDFKWANHAWGTDLITYAVYSFAGFWGLSLLAAGVITLTFFIFSKAAKLDIWDQSLLFPLFFVLEDAINKISFRAQLLSILFLGIEYYILCEYIRGNVKKIWLLPVLFIFWANLHGQFSLGLIVLVIFCFGIIVKNFFENYENRLQILSQLSKSFIIILISIFIVTLINPFGFALYGDIFTHFNNPWQKYVLEWLPFLELSSFWWRHILVGVLAFFGMFSLFFMGKIRSFIPQILVIVSLYVTPLLVRRFAWSYYYLVFPILKPLTEILKPPKKYLSKIVTIILLITLLGVINIKLPILTSSMDWKLFCEINACSIKGAQFLLDHKLIKDNDNFFTIYNWGGFLIWNFPEIKPPIDGRMHLWQDERGYSAFAEFYPIEQDWVNIDKTKYNIAFVSPTKPVYYRLLKLSKEKKWRQVYEDDVSGIFVRK
ncbi:hypothetical protein HYW54_00520 [Candidatus Gottesmanbacteria bacterium]|nr:hypothetical protein [Candidatus Gottesmanbacteria bacterium]